MSEEKKERFEELLTGYVLGTLTRVELDEFQRLRDEGVPTGAMSITEARELLAELPSAVRTPAPSPGVKQRLMAQVGAGVKAEKRQQATSYWTRSEIPPLAWAAIFVLALVNLGMFAQTLRLQSEMGKLASQNSKMKSQVATLISESAKADQLKDDFARVRKELDRQRTLNAMLTNPDVRVANMKATKSDCVARLYSHPTERIVLICTQSLPELGAGKDYQLWALIDGKPVSVGILGAPQDGIYRVQAPPAVPMEKNPGYAISLEPKGGMPQPTGEIVFASL